MYFSMFIIQTRCKIFLTFPQDLISKQQQTEQTSKESKGKGAKEMNAFLFTQLLACNSFLVAPIANVKSILQEQNPDFFVVQMLDWPSGPPLRKAGDKELTVSLHLSASPGSFGVSAGHDL